MKLFKILIFKILKINKNQIIYYYNKKLFKFKNIYYMNIIKKITFF